MVLRHSHTRGFGASRNCFWDKGIITSISACPQTFVPIGFAKSGIGLRRSDVILWAGMSPPPFWLHPSVFDEREGDRIGTTVTYHFTMTRTIDNFIFPLRNHFRFLSNSQCEFHIHQPWINGAAASLCSQMFFASTFRLIVTIRITIFTVQRTKMDIYAWTPLSPCPVVSNLIMIANSPVIKLRNHQIRVTSGS